MFTRSEMDQFQNVPSKNMLTGLLQKHIQRVSIRTLSKNSSPQSREAWHPIDSQATEVSPRSLLIEAIRVRKNYKKSTLIKQGAFNAFYQLTDTVMGTFAYRPEQY